MSQDSRCLFCQQLPATARIKGGKPAKCPVCKGDLLLAWDVTYRLLTAEEIALEPRVSKSRSWKPAAILVLAACLVLTIWVGKQFMHGGNNSAKEIQAAAVPEMVARASIPVQAALPMAPAQARPIPVANNPDTVAARKSVYNAKGTTKAIPENVWWFPVAKENPTNALTSVAKVLPAPSNSKLFMKQSRFASQFVASRPKTLAEVPELALGDHPLPTSLSEKEDSISAKYKITQRVEEIFKLTKDDPDAFVKQIRERADLSGLPFMMGEQCRLSAKSASELRNSSRSIRRELDTSRRGFSLPSHYSGTDSKKVEEIILDRMFQWKQEHLAAHEQILLAENSAFRNHFMKKLASLEGKTATRILAQRALFDVAADVRETALEALKKRPPQDVEPFLLQGLRYPWPQAVHNAAEAVVKLNRTDLAPNLVDMLDMLDPDVPFLGGPKKDQLMVRELVRVNHHRNCLLCHAPVEVDVKDRKVFALPLGPIPIPGEAMPTSSVVYYSLRPGQNAVRADVTYLRQDFSVMLPVANSAPWPAEQRYDFFVRLRVLKDEQAANIKNRIQPKATAYKTAIVQALKALTGQDAGYSAAAWRRALDPILEKAWRSSCNK
jgi:hypothetical protein